MSTIGISFDYHIDDGIACVYARRGAFVFGINLEEKDRLFRLFEELESNDNVRAVLLFNDADAFDENEHRHYIQSLSALKGKDRQEVADEQLEREDNAVKQFALIAAGFRKLLVTCLRGRISTPFFALSLMTDLRLAARDMAFILSHV